MPDLRDFTSYDLARLHESLVEINARYRDAPGPTNLWGRAQEFLPWNHSFRRCWDDPSFSARYRWLRARLIPEGSSPDYPLSRVTSDLAALIAERVAQEAEEPF